MFKREITFENIDGAMVTRTYYFHLNKADLADMELRFGTDGLEKHFREVVAANDRGAVLDLFKYIFQSSIGRREGDLFIKDEKTVNDFMFSGAYAQLFVELFKDPAQILEFFRAVVPASMKGAIDEVAAREGYDQKLQAIVDVPPATPMSEVQIGTASVEETSEGLHVSVKPKSWKEYPIHQLVSMPRDQFDAIMKEFRGGNTPKELLQVAIKRIQNEIKD